MPTAAGACAALASVGRRLLAHPGPSTVAVQRTVALVVIDCMLTGFRWGKRLWPLD